MLGRRAPTRECTGESWTKVAGQQFPTHVSWVSQYLQKPSVLLIVMRYLGNSEHKREHKAKHDAVHSTALVQYCHQWTCKDWKNAALISFSPLKDLKETEIQPYLMF